MSPSSQQATDTLAKRPDAADTQAAAFALSRLTAPRPANALWQRLQDHAFDHPGDARPLSARLAQVTGWSAPHARHVLEEYRRFLYLAVRLQGRVCPSEAVDEAWHAHLLDSQRYFERFCPRVLQFTLHHVPSRGGADAPRHVSRYRATLLAYEHVFGEAPPRDIWPPAEERFRPAAPIHRATHWAIAKPAWWAPAQRRAAARTLRTLALTFTLPALLVAGCAPGGFTFAAGVSGPQFLMVYLALFGALVAWGVWQVLRPAPAQAPGVRNTRLGALDLAYLASGSLRAVQTALASLLQRGSARIHDGAGVLNPREPRGLRAAAGRRGPVVWHAQDEPPPHAHPLEHALYRQLRRGAQPEAAVKSLQPELDALHTGLHEKGLLHSAWRDKRTLHTRDAVYRVAWFGLLAFGALRLVHGVLNGRPIGFLLVLLVLSFAFMAFFLSRLPQRLTREGKAAVQRETLALRRTRNLGMADPLMPLALALLGVAALGADMQPLRDAMAPMTARDTGSSGCGGSSSCSGDGGGGDGGGGCGGCGGGGD